MTTEPSPADVRQFFRRLSGNEQKILLAIYYLDQDGTPTTAENISHEAMIDRSTVFRNLKRLHENAYVEHRLTQKGRACVDYALTAQAATIIPAQVALHNRYYRTLCKGGRGSGQAVLSPTRKRLGGSLALPMPIHISGCTELIALNQKPHRGSVRFCSD